MREKKEIEVAPSKALQGVLWMFLAACAASVLMNPGCECDSGHPPGAAQTQPDAPVRP